MLKNVCDLLRKLKFKNKKSPTADERFDCNSEVINLCSSVIFKTAPSMFRDTLIIFFIGVGTSNSSLKRLYAPNRADQDSVTLSALRLSVEPFKWSEPPVKSKKKSLGARFDWVGVRFYQKNKKKIILCK